MSGVEDDASGRGLGGIPEQRHEYFVIITLREGEVAALGADRIVEHHLHAVDEDELFAVFRVEGDAGARDVTFGEATVAALAGRVAQAQLAHGFTEIVVGRGRGKHRANAEQQEYRCEAPHDLIPRRSRRCPLRSRPRRLPRPGSRCARAFACSAGRASGRRRSRGRCASARCRAC